MLRKHSTTLFKPAPASKAEPDANDIAFTAIYAGERITFIDAFLKNESELIKGINAWQAEFVTDNNPDNKWYAPLKGLILALSIGLDTDTNASDSIAKISDKLTKLVDNYLFQWNKLEAELSAISDANKKMKHKEQHAPEIEKLQKEMIDFSNSIPTLISKKATERKSQLTEESLALFHAPKKENSHNTPADEVEFIKNYMKKDSVTAIDAILIKIHEIDHPIELWQAEILRDGEPKNERYTRLKDLIMTFANAIDTNPNQANSVSKIPDTLMKMIEEYLPVWNKAKAEFETLTDDEEKDAYRKKHMPACRKLADEILIFSRNIPALILQKALERKAEIVVEGLQQIKEPAEQSRCTIM